MSSLYETDFYAWILDQTALLRAGHMQNIDIDHLVEEMEAMGRREHRELDSRVTVLLMHLLKWHYQSTNRSRSWRLTIQIQSEEIWELLKESPSLKVRMTESIKKGYRKARLLAARETGLPEENFPETCPWTVETLKHVCQSIEKQVS